ncbi:styrene monooxygenase/indole monooxygenase family protein [Nocardia sp. KC 131]|uniref:styrene monooxygenase/indole monooxygenase family protein n=1 Tax=Nocardia arseniciresistens TaxID=3392119 RepID=UPI00398F59FB
MKHVQVLGAGECGLPLARRLLDGGMPVTLVADRSAEAILSGSVTSTQVKFPYTLDLEAAAGLGHWRSTAPEIKGIRFNLVVERNAIAGWSGHFGRPAQSVDQRTVFARWITDFLAAGGDLQITDLSLEDVDRRAAEYDLTVVTRASRDLAACFPDDPAWTVPAAPQRQLSVLYLDGVQPEQDDLGTYVALPELGELVSYPGLTGQPGRERRCEMLLFAAKPGRELDVFSPLSTSVERLRQTKELLERYLPAAFADRYRDAELTDSGATLVGGVTPVMRQPIGTLPSGRLVLGGADIVCRMDPSGAQGANNAVHCGIHYGNTILDNPDGPYDRDWMHATAAPWLADIAHPAARWTTALLDPPPAMQRLMLTAALEVALADSFADTFARPANMSTFLAGAES